VLLRLDRVFISPNTRNIEVFRTIADHEDYRHQVKDIVWDDTQLPRDITLSNKEFSEIVEGRLDWEYIFQCSTDGIPDWFAYGCYRNNIALKRKPLEGESGLSLKDSWSYYLQLLVQQHDLLASHADTLTFSYELGRFPCLKRTTLTAAAHGFLDNPGYETSMTRSFPRGFNYPFTHAWSPPKRRDRVGVLP
jgi:hypothetical protein